MSDALGTMSDELSPAQSLLHRTMQLAVRIIRLSAAMPKSAEARVIRNPFLRSGTAVGAHYREARRSWSTAEFVSKIETAIQELDETAYWLEVLSESGIVKKARLRELRDEVEQRTAMLAASAKTAKERRATEK
jgi:four helix bundle protein